jgi:cobalt-zinc-cadmium efflux system protein
MTSPVAVPISAQCVHVVPRAPGDRRRLTWVLALTAGVMVAEVVGGVVGRSLALLADAGHMLTDVAALGLALLAARLAHRPASPERTFGLIRIEIVAALVNGAALLAITAWIVVEAVRRLGAPPEVRPDILLGVASLGLAANLVAAVVLHRSHSHSLNVRGAYLHVLGDLLGSVGAVIAGGVILLTGWRAADPLISIAISLLILHGAWRLIRESVDILLEATPRHIALSEVHTRLVSIPGVSGVHDLHVWTLTTGMVAMSGHAVVTDPADGQRVLQEAQARMDELGIRHSTVQIEKGSTCN